MNDDSHRKSAAPKIGDIPNEVLAQVFKQLEWRDKVRVEGVSPRWRGVALAQGWTKVRDLDELEGWMGHEQYRGLLSRAGHYITRLEIEEGDAVEVDANALREELEQCPNLKHLSLWWHQLDETTLGLISAYGTNLKSLKIREIERPPARPNQEILAAMSEAIRQCSSLEFLALEGTTKVMFSVNFRLYAPSLANLCHLSICCFDEEEGRILNAENTEQVLCSLPSLRSLFLWPSGVSDLAFLSRLRSPHLLESLEISVDPGNLEHLIEALPRLGQSLLMLSIGSQEGQFPIALVERLFFTIGSHFPRLKFLELGLYNGSYVDSRGAAVNVEEAVKCFYPALTTPWLRDLRVLLLGPPPPPCIWPWVEQSLGQLEYLDSISYAPPLSQLCNLAKKCKKLRHLRFENYSPTADDRMALAAAVAQRESDGNAPIPTLSFTVAEGHEDREPASDEDTQLRFVRGEDFLREMLDDYRYGALSERPNFEA